MNSQPAPPPPSLPDDGLDWLRDIRRRISAEHGHDPQKYGDYLRELEKRPEYAHRMVRVRKVLEPVNP